MEPMTLGSPVGSSTSPLQTPPNSLQANPFLPTYLMGDIASLATSGSHIATGGTSPNKTNRQCSSSTSISSQGSPQPSKESLFSARLCSEKPGGPPTQSLMGVRGVQNLTQSPIRFGGSPYVDHRIPGSSTPGSSYGVSLPSSCLNSPYTPQGQSSNIKYQTSYTQIRDQPSFISQDIFQQSAYDILEDNFLTIFGFPPASASYILSQFTQLGTIIEHRNPGSGNWMHIKYQTKMQARKALSKNGKIFGGNIMVGVVLCSDKDVLAEKENISLLNTSNFTSPNNSSITGLPRSHIRPLTQAYQTVHAELEVIPKANTPKRDDSLMSRAIQHILGI